MDRALKERIAGAVVLVIIAVLVVPVFLDGPKPGTEMVREPVTLPGQDGSDDRRTVVLQLDRDQPLPVSNSEREVRPVATSSPAAGDSAPAAAEQGATPVPVASTQGAREPEPEPVREPDPEPEPPVREQAPPPSEAPAGKAATESASESATGMWAVQIGSFSNKENADRLAAGLREKGYAAFLSQVRTGGGELHRVRIGPQKDRASAEAVAAKLASDNVDGQVVPHP